MYVSIVSTYLHINQSTMDRFLSVSVGILGAFAPGPRALKAKTKQNKTKQNKKHLLYYKISFFLVIKL